MSTKADRVKQFLVLPDIKMTKNCNYLRQRTLIKWRELERTTRPYSTYTNYRERLEWLIHARCSYY